MKTAPTKQISVMMIAALLAAAPLSLAQTAPKNIVDTVQESVTRKKPVYTTLIKLLDASGLTAELKTGGPYTLFAPIDNAFASLPAGQVDNLLKPENKEELVKLLKHHIVAGKMGEAELSQKTEVTPMEGAPLKISSKGALVKRVNDASTGDEAVEASNGMIYRIKKVLVP